MQSAHVIGLSTLGIGAVVAAICVLFALDRLALWMEGRGWIYYRRRRASTSTLGNAFLEVQALVEPGQRLVLEARQEDRVEDHESGDPPDPVANGEGGVGPTDGG